MHRDANAITRIPLCRCGSLVVVEQEYGRLMPHYSLVLGIQHKQVSEGKDGKEHMTTTAYIFSLVGYAIGIGNVWRFPYVISKNGGSAAVMAYLICAVLVAWPLFIYEMILGQYLRKTFVATWTHIRPRWASFACAQFLLLFIAQTYFSVVITYTLPYIAASNRVAFKELKLSFP